jgi:hypothetical protein
MRNISSCFLAGLLGLGALGPAAWAEPPLSVTLSANKIVPASNGRETAVPAESAAPGDVIEYTAEYVNHGKSALPRVEATLPVPRGTAYLPSLAAASLPKASLDGTRFQTIPLKRLVRRADGRTSEELVPYADYRYLRWYPGELASGKSIKFSARVRILSDAAPIAADAAAERKFPTASSAALLAATK